MREYDIQLPEFRVHMVEMGQGAPVLFVHGLLVNHLEWKYVAERLENSFRCLLIDLPGFGSSDRPSPDSFPYSRQAFSETLYAVIQELGLEQVHLVGHSLGGAIALTFAAQFPQHVTSLAVLDSACYPFPAPLKGRLATWPGVGPLLFSYLYGRSMFRAYFQNDVWNHHPGIRMEDVDAYYRDFDSPESRKAAHATLSATLELASMAPLIQKTSAPALVMWGSQDTLTPIGLGHRLARELPNAKLEILEGCAHAANEEQPEQVARHLREHFQMKP